MAAEASTRSGGLLTRRGWGVLAASAVLAVPAGLVGSRELATVVACGLVAVALAVLWVFRKPRLEVTREIYPHRVARDVDAIARVSVANRAVLPSTPAVGLDPCGDVVSEIPLPRLAPGRVRARTYELPTGRRGRFTVGPLRIARVDPLGLAHRVQLQGGTETLWVHPRQHLVSTVGGGRVRRLDGPEVDRLPHGTITFHALREYVRGDDLRHVHWRTSARIGQLMVREHIDVSVPVITLFVDNRASVHDAASFEDALEVVASLLAAAARERYACVVLAASGERVGGSAHVGETGTSLDLLAALQLTDAPLDDAVATLTREPARDTLVIATGHPTLGDLAPLVGLRRQYPRTVVVAVNGDQPLALGVPGIEVVTAADGAAAVHQWNVGVRR
ncbi:DUF58 domain-containing protein [Aquihabitans sp. G128]|uniref:DUF58 domain-containing protein n=1 Tax=Aquihabitans sp. G128 TaxID=2849779 RepID=UPI001C2409BA|nr:DUF58 domain-containing protein [Aquihabitans sp. G128]QXC63149.1 DUF58 domain-containing protein [Aquihabitans sp. G128]